MSKENNDNSNDHDDNIVEDESTWKCFFSFLEMFFIFVFFGNVFLLFFPNKETFLVSMMQIDRKLCFLC